MLKLNAYCNEIRWELKTRAAKKVTKDVKLLASFRICNQANYYDGIQKYK